MPDEKVQNDVRDLALVELDNDTKTILNQLIVETDIDKTKDLTNLFNINQTKKTMVRVDKLSQLMDTLADQAIKRFEEHPDELSNQEIFLGLKTVQDVIEKSRRQIMGADTQPFIQINQQTNEVNVGQTQTKESRERVMKAVNDVLKSILPAQNTNASTTIQPPIINTEDYEDDEQD